MDRHVPWSARLERVLASLGAGPREIFELRRFRDHICAKKTPSPRLRLSAAAQKTLFQLFVDPQAVYEAQAYLDQLSERALGESELKKERAREADRGRQQKWRDAHRDDYNAYQKALMRTRYQAQKDDLAALDARISPFQTSNQPLDKEKA